MDLVGEVVGEVVVLNVLLCDLIFDDDDDEMNLGLWLCRNLSFCDGLLNRSNGLCEFMNIRMICSYTTLSFPCLSKLL